MKVLSSLRRCWHDSNPVALYRYHRDHCGFGKLQAIRRTAVCWFPSF